MVNVGEEILNEQVELQTKTKEHENFQQYNTNNFGTLYYEMAYILQKIRLCIRTDL